MSDSLCLHLRLEIPEFTKVGLRVDRKNRVISVASGSPAALAGLMPNDLIEQVEGLSLTAERGVQAALADRTTSAPLLRVRRGGGGRRAKPSKSDGQPASEVEACEEGNGEGGFETLLLSLSLKAGERAGMRVDANEVLTVAPDTPAAMAGLRAGDVVAEVDGVAVGEGGATTLLHALSDRSRPSRSLTVVRRRAASKSASPATEAKAEGAEEAEGELEEELLCVELSRDGAGSLGIKALQGGQIVSVMPGGAAASAGLAAGDDILEVDGEEVVGSSSGIFSLLPPTKEDDLSPPVMCVGGSVADPNSQCEQVPAAGGLLAARAPEGRDGGRRRRRPHRWLFCSALPRGVHERRLGVTQPVAGRVCAGQPRGERAGSRGGGGGGGGPGCLRGVAPVGGGL